MIKFTIQRNGGEYRKMWAVRDDENNLRAAGIYGNTYERAALVSFDEYNDMVAINNKNGRKYDIEPVLWTFEIDEEVQDYEELTRLSVEMLANEAFAEQCQDESPANDEVFEHPVKLLAFQYNDDGERVILEEIETHLIYCHYHGDLKEHGTW